MLTRKCALSALMMLICTSALAVESAKPAPRVAAKPALAAAATPAAAHPAGTKAPAPTLPPLSAEQIVAKNVAARGGLAAWQAVDTLVLSGQMEAGGAQNPSLPFVMKLKRAHKSRLELQFGKSTAVQVFDGSQGWKLRPFLNRDDVEAYSADERKQALLADELDGPLIDYAKKGSTLSLAGTEMVDDHPAYVIEIATKNGNDRKVWIDGKSFLELKIQGTARKLDRHAHPVSVYYRDYLVEGGLAMPKVVETRVEGLKSAQAAQAGHKMVIEHVAVNLPLDDAQFEKPSAADARTAAK